MIGRRKESGFTLLELLIALGILGVGLLGIVKIQMQSGFGNMTARNRTAAVNLARSKVEEFRRIKEYYIPAAGAGTIIGSELINDGDNNDLGNWASPDHQVTGNLTESGDSGGRFIMVWNIADSTPEINMKTVRIRVAWNEGGIPRTMILETQIARKNLEYYQ
jgi:type IV pilus assembly protein PilV